MEMLRQLSPLRPGNFTNRPADTTVKATKLLQQHMSKSAQT